MERCPSCNGTGWVKASHVCTSSVSLPPWDRIPESPTLLDPIRGEPLPKSSPPTTEGASSDSVITWIIVILFILAIVFIPEFRLLVQDVILWLWSLLWSLIKSLITAAQT